MHLRDRRMGRAGCGEDRGEIQPGPGQVADSVQLCKYQVQTLPHSVEL